jgi:hypothetical protein
MGRALYAKGNGEHKGMGVLGAAIHGDKDRNQLLNQERSPTQ